MDSRFYVSYEAARLLKVKGYKRHVNQYYDENGFLHDLAYDENYDYQMSNNDLDLDHYAAPAKSEAIDWLESKGMVVDLYYDNDFDKDDSKWEYYIFQYDNNGVLNETVSSYGGMDGFYDTRLEAEEAAIIKALELL